ncbi:hypothetical protein E2C01_043168 [Portunus trituberculatus]|uniref:Uncharacterized protein n=1 Tax=Portunus trituberculatus TaxID=210409 RepID=A0A5B7FVK7_PORTR|nr:hypothetical protein [Portunus trituberculatus]
MSGEMDREREESEKEYAENTLAVALSRQLRREERWGVKVWRKGYGQLIDRASLTQAALWGQRGDVRCVLTAPCDLDTVAPYTSQ